MTAVESPTDLLATARRLSPLVVEHAAEGERRGTMPEPVVDAFAAAGLFGLMLPRELGGAEADLRTVLGVFEELSRADGSTGWSLLANATTSAFAGAYCGDEAVAAMFSPGTPAIHAGMLGPVGECRATEGGFVVHGRFRFGSGSGHASWLGGGAFEDRDGETAVSASGLPVMRVFFVPRDRVEFLGNWDVMGLVATGSFDYDIPEQVVPEAFTFSLLEPEVRRGGPLYRLGVLGLTSAGHAAFALGVGRRAIEELVGVARTKQRLASGPLAENPLLHHDLGFHDAALRSARAYVYEVFGAAQDALDAGREPTMVEHQRLRQATTYATKVAADVVRGCYEWAGTDALRPSPLQRCFRDIHAGTQHLFVDPSTISASGQLLLAEV